MRGLSIVIPSKTPANLTACLRAIRAAGEDCRVIVIDDGLGTSPEIEAVRDQHTVLDGAKPFIFARNVNIGIRAAGDDDVIVTNDDALLESPGGFSIMQRAAEEHPEFGVIGATTNVTGQPLQWRQSVGLREVPHIAFVCVLIPRRTINLIGLLDERYCLDYGVEDLDYCETVTRAGLKVGVHDSCFVDHGSLTSSFRGAPLATLGFARNKALFDAKWGLLA